MTGANLDLTIGTMTSDFLVGIDRFSHAHLRKFREFFTNVVRQRGFPLHTACLWNALYFGWDLDEKRYIGRGLDMTAAEDGKPIPVGAFVELTAGRRRLWAEVVYKEGRDSRIDELGIVDPAASGARLGLAGARDRATVTEGLILDFDALGPGLNDDSEVGWQRAGRKGWLTGERHKEVHADYSAESAGIDDLALFAQYVMDVYGEHLFDDLLLDYGHSVGPDDRWQLLLTSLNSVGEIASTATGLCTFGLYHLDAAMFNADRAGAGGAALASETIGAVANTIVRSATSSPMRTPTYVAVGPLVREYLGRSGIDPVERKLLEGPGYARTVLEANLAVADRIGERGLIDGELVRLDDDWQGGGVWRATRYEGRPPVESLYSPLTPLGLGYSGSITGHEGLAGGITESEPEVASRSSDRDWKVPLRLIDLHYGDLPLSPDAMAMLSPDTSVVRLSFRDGSRAEEVSTKPLDRARRLVRDIAYPPDVRPGTYVGYSIGSGGRSITLRTFPLDVTVELEGRTFRFDFNERVFRRDLHLEPLAARDLRGAPTLTDEINLVFRRRGRVSEDGGRSLRAEEVVAAIIGPVTDPVACSPIVLQLQQGDFEYRSPEYVWHPRVSRRTSPRERTRIGAAGGHEGGRVARMVAPHRVPMGLRHYTKNKPSPTKIESYPAARIKNHAEHRLPETLPPGCSWVKPYFVGTR